MEQTIDINYPSAVWIGENRVWNIQFGPAPQLGGHLVRLRNHYTCSCETDDNCLFFVRVKNRFWNQHDDYQFFLFQYKRADAMPDFRCLVCTNHFPVKNLSALLFCRHCLHVFDKECISSLHRDSCPHCAQEHFLPYGHGLLDWPPCQGKRPREGVHEPFVLHDEKEKQQAEEEAHHDKKMKTEVYGDEGHVMEKEEASEAAQGDCLRKPSPDELLVSGSGGSGSGGDELTEEEEETLLRQMNYRKHHTPALQKQARQFGKTWAEYLRWNAAFTQELLERGVVEFIEQDEVEGNTVVPGG